MLFEIAFHKKIFATVTESVNFFKMYFLCLIKLDIDESCWLQASQVKTLILISCIINWLENTEVLFAVTIIYKMVET